MKCVISDCTIGGGEEAATPLRPAVRHAECVRHSLSVTPCWCYGSETMDLDPPTIKAVWALTAPSVPARCIFGRRYGRP